MYNRTYNFSAGPATMPVPVLEEIRDELLNVHTPEFWEVSDRGMNFDYMPETDWKYGYPALIAVLSVVTVLLYRALRRNGWL